MHWEMRNTLGLGYLVLFATALSLHSAQTTASRQCRPTARAAHDRQQRLPPAPRRSIALNGFGEQLCVGSVFRYRIWIFSILKDLEGFEAP